MLQIAMGYPYLSFNCYALDDHESGLEPMFILLLGYDERGVAAANCNGASICRTELTVSKA